MLRSVACEAGRLLPFFRLRKLVRINAARCAVVRGAGAGCGCGLLDVPGFDVGVRAGYRQVHLQLDDVDGIDAEATFKGPFLGVQVHF